MLRNHPRPLSCLLTIALITLVPGGAGAQEQEAAAEMAQATALRVFLDCGFCDFDHLRREITFVNYVRSREDADVHVLVTIQAAGAGTAYALDFIGRGAFDGNTDRHEHVASVTDTWDETRDAIAQVLKVGLLHYLIETPYANDIAITHTNPVEAPATAQPGDDPWNFWVFRTRFNGRISGEETRTSQSISGSFSASRTTEAWKIDAGVNARYSDTSFELTDSTFLNAQRNFGLTGQIVKSLGEHWGASLRTSANGSTFVNQDLTVSIAPGIEYNIFPYSESSRRQLTITYEVGTSALNYDEETIFGKTSETLVDESVIVSLAMQQPWGSTSVSAEVAHYLHDIGKYGAVFFGFLDFRITRGLSVNVFGDASLVRNQLYLPRRGATDEEILVQRRQLETSYRYSISVGVTYTFGSIFNNIVNPRFGGGRGGIIRFF